MNKAVLAGIIAGIIIVGLAIGYSVGTEKQETAIVNEQNDEAPQPRNITIELSDGIVFNEGP